MISIQRSYGDFCALRPPLRLGGPRRTTVFAFGPAHNEQVLGHPEIFRTGGQGIPGPRGSSQSQLRQGLTRMKEPKHKAQRQLVMPTVLKSSVDRYLPAMRSIINEELAGWRPGLTVNMDTEMRRITMRIAGETLFGERERARSLSFGSMVSEWLRRNYTFGATYFPVDFIGTSYRGLLQFAERLSREIREMIRLRRARADERGDILSLLVKARDERKANVSERDLLGQTAILFAASFETTATTLGWTLFLLAQSPAVAVKLRDEITAATSTDMEDLPLLDAVIKESMRILPPVALTLRAVTKSTELDGLELQKGDRVICSHYLTHRIADLYRHPNRFEPERWFSIKPGHYEYIPFSAGPRQCIGPVFATRVIKQVLAAIMPRLCFRIVEGSRIDRDFRVTMVPRRGLPMTLHEPHDSFKSMRVRGNIHQMVDLAIDN
ncbi:MAG TPA: cytochrome P450 [Pseudorhodoplanes sp.]|nr:cytochrome P450 [Pseudorhodoplanes sp.]